MGKQPQRPASTEGRFVRLAAAAVFDARLSAEAVRVLAAFASYADRNGQCWPAVGTVAERLGVTRRAIQYALKHLEQAGYLVKEHQTRARGGYGTSKYTLLFPPALPTSARPIDVKPDFTSDRADDAKPGFTSADLVTGPVTASPMRSPASPPMCNGASLTMRNPASPKLYQVNNTNEPNQTRASAREVVVVAKPEVKGPTYDPTLDEWLLWAGIDDCPPTDYVRMAGELYQALDNGIGNEAQRDKIRNFAEILNRGATLSEPQKQALRGIHQELSKGPGGIDEIACRKIRRRFPGWERGIINRQIGSLLIAAAKCRDADRIDRLLRTTAAAE